MKYIHGIDLSNFYPCHNIGIDGVLRTPSLMALADPEGIGKVQKSVDSYSIDDIKNGMAQLGAVTPRFIAVGIEAALLRSGCKIVDGYDREILYSEETRAEKIKRADIELAFEAFRRENHPQKVSRLSSIYLAERSAAGKDLVRNMLGSDVEILEVKIACSISLTKADVSWLDKYADNPKDEYIANYWGEVKCSEEDTWEYLLDGAIEVEDLSLLKVLDNGASIAEA